MVDIKDAKSTICFKTTGYNVLVNYLKLTVATKGNQEECIPLKLTTLYRLYRVLYSTLDKFSEIKSPKKGNYFNEK